MKKRAIALVLGIVSCVLCGNTAVRAQEGKAECVMEMSSRRILYESNGDTRLPMASTTKIVTAITVLEICEDLQSEIIIPNEAVGIEGSSVYLQEGDTYTVKELLMGLMLRSGNDCAMALALNFAENICDFTAKMNREAQKTGALNSSFKNPHGLPERGHYTTARDLTAISCYAMENVIFREIVSTKYYQPRHWKNKNKMLVSYEGAIGVKTGYTKEAGRCLVSAVEREGMCLICTLLNCPTTYERTCALFDDIFSAYTMVKLLEKGEKFVLDGRECIAMEEFSYPLLEGEESGIEYQIYPAKEGGNKEILGYLEFTLAKRLLFSTNLYKL